ncbi:hypothetical protein AM493_06195 [Flavobacterium akiainvivens]|uniref:YDG domain-containing protein n=1 Tax=Flavobacterium akiainvivens TaxID=1202724 RepID=A0A0M8MHF5_9FLAO|nr:YDG domain-containing protein [Flavobacterium akiainvivens]KOS05668.1 hypothetical protein AM493_06195 [Flavobacterium akiainvivens]
MTLFLFVFSAQLSWGQTWTYDFGTAPSSSWTTASTANTTFLPAPSTDGGTARVRNSTAAGGSAIYLDNPGLSSLGTGAELRIRPTTSASLSKVSIYDYAGDSQGYIKFSVVLANATSGNTVFAFGNGSFYSDNNSYDNTAAGVTFGAVKWTWGSNNITTQVQTGSTASTWVQSTLTSTTGLIQKDVKADIEIYFNNTNSTTAKTYTRNGSTYSIAQNKWDFWINGVLVGDDVAKAALVNNAVIDSFIFFNESSTATALTYIDDIEYSSVLPSVAIGTVTPDHLDYGNIAVGSTDTKTFTVAQGTGITGNITAATTAPFQVSLDNTTFSSSVSFANPASGSPRTIYVKYSPAAAGQHTDGVTVSVGSVSKTVIVGGTGISSIGTLSTDMLDYGNVAVGTTSTQTFTVGHGTGITGNITATTTAPFQISLDGSTFGNSVSFANPATGTTQTLYVRYSPTASGPHTEAVTLTSTGATPKQLAAGGTGVTTIGTIAPDHLDYGNVNIDTNSTLSFTVGHGTGITGNITAATIAPFQVSLDNTTFSNSVSFANPATGATQTVYVKYSPLTEGPHTEGVAVSTTGATTQNVIVGGTGIASAAIGTVSTDMLDYGNVAVGSTSTQTFTVGHGTGISGNITASTIAPFQVSLDGVTFSSSVAFANPATGVTQTVYVKYSPVTSGPHTEAVIVNATGATEKTIAAGGTGIIAIGTLTPDFLDYGYVNVGSSSVQSFTVSAGTGISGNITAATVAPFQVSLDNTTFSNSVAFANPATGTTQTVYVKYSPAATGPHTEAVTLNAAGATEKALAAGGTGIIIPVITSATTDSSVYNTADTYTITSTGTAPVTFSASNVPAGATFTASSGTISFPATFAASETPYNISITATNNYGSDTKTLVYTRSKASQTLGSFATTDTKVYGTGSYTPSLTATSNLGVTYTSSNQAVATTNGATITIVGVGTTTITASQAGDTNWNAAPEKTQTLTVTPKALTVTGASASNKVYDATNTAAITGTYVLNGVVNSEVALSGTPAGTFATTTVGNNINVTITGFTITPANANYTLTQPVSSANITARPVTITATAQDKTYDGTVTATITPGYTVNNTVNSEVLTVTGAFTNADAGTNKTVNLTLGGTTAANYSISSEQTPVTASINKAAHPGFTVNAITTSLNTPFTITSTNVNAPSNGAYTYGSSNNSIFTVSGNTLTGLAAGTATLNISQAEGTNYLASTTGTANNTVQVTVANVIYPYNSFLSTGGAYTNASSWCKCNTVVNSPCTGTTPGQGGWSAVGVNGTPSAAQTVFIKGAVTGATTGATNLTILSGGELTVTSTYPISSSLLVKDGGKLNINSSLFNLSSTSATFTVEDNAEVVVNATSSNMTNFLWRGIESFAGNSTFTFLAANNDNELFTLTDITNNSATGAKFGNLVIAPTTLAGNYTYAFPNTSGSIKLTHGNLTITNATIRNIGLNASDFTIGGNFIVNPTSTGSINIQSQGGAKTFTVNGNVIKNGTGTFRGTTASTANASLTFKIDGDLIVNEGNIIPQATNSATVTSVINLKGDLTIASGAAVTNQLSSAGSVNNTINFTGTGNGLTDVTTQTIDIASTANTNLVFNIKSGAYVKLANNDFQTAANNTFTIETGGTFDTDVYKLSGSGTFTSATNSTIATANTAGIGGSVTSSSKTFNDATNYIFNGITTTPFPATITKARNITTNANVTLNGTITPSGDVAVSAGTLNLNSLNLNRSAQGGTFTIATGATVNVVGGSAQFPANYTTKDFQPNSTVEYTNNSTDVTVGNIAGANYQNVKISGTGGKVLSDGLIVNNDFTIASENPVITVTTGKTITVKNKVINQAAADKFVIANNAALVQVNEVSNTGQVTVNRDSNPLYRLDYTLWGSPVAGQNLFAFSDDTAVNRFYTYGLNTNGEENYLAVPDPAAINFAPATGYLIRMPNNLPDVTGYNTGDATYVDHGVFTGTLNNGTVGAEAGNLVNHYIAVANPYASPISVVDFFTQNSGVLEAGEGIYFWRKKNNALATSYAHLSMAGFTANSAAGGNIENGGAYYYGGNTTGSTNFNENWIISPAQGFLVKLKDGISATSKVNFTNSMRRGVPAIGQPFFRTQNNNDAPAVSRWWINLTGADVFSQSLVSYMPQATTGLDYGYDARAISDGPIALYSKEAEDNLAIQARPAFEVTDVVPMGFNITTAGEYTLTLDHVDGQFAQGQDIFVKDNLLGTVHNLQDGAYTFISGAGSFDTRFEVLYQTDGELGTNQPELANMVLVYQQNGAINITSGSVEMTGVTLYDIRGRKLYEQNGINATQTSVSNLAVAQQVIIAEIQTVNGTVSKKIVY